MPEFEDRIDTTSVMYDGMSERWPLLHDLLGGTKTMRAAGERWLPREEAESLAAYERRLGRSILYSGYKDTIVKLSAKPFSKPVVVNEVPESLSYLEKDTDGTGRTITQLSKDCMDDLATYGKAHILVDYSAIEENAEGAPITIGEEKRRGGRVTFIRISPVNLIGWRTTQNNAGAITLEQIRIKSARIEPKGEYGDEEVKYIRKLTSTDWELWKKTDDKEEYVKSNEGTHTFGRVYLVTIYADCSGYLTSNPPLEGLAWLNLAHWQSSSDQKNILRFTRFAILFIKGLSQEERDAQTVLGPTQSFKTTNENADMKYVEHTGKAIEAGRKDLEDTEFRMEVQGLQPLAKSSARSTATGKNIDEARNDSAIQAWIKVLEEGIEEAYGMAAEWSGTELPEDFSIDIYSDFKVSLWGSTDVDKLLKACIAGKMSKRTFLLEIQRRGMISEDIDIDQELKEIEEDSSILDGLLAVPEDEPEDDDE